MLQETVRQYESTAGGKRNKISSVNTLTLEM